MLLFRLNVNKACRGSAVRPGPMVMLACFSEKPMTKWKYRTRLTRQKLAAADVPNETPIALTLAVPAEEITCPKNRHRRLGVRFLPAQQLWAPRAWSRRIWPQRTTYRPASRRTKENR